MVGSSISEMLGIFSEDYKYIIFTGYNNIIILVLTHNVMFPVQLQKSVYIWNVQEHSAVENIWDKGKGSTRRLEKTV
jgi:hypothetical protein